MLQIQHIRKEYRTGKLVQKALDDVSLNLRDSEFVAILGPSGSGKTTLLNIIGGLDRYDSGDLVINGISTKKYKDRDWDSYRNHTIGFVFQSYNLIPHQTVLANVELAMTISGISGSERRRRATEALEKVGLGQQLHKKPSQMSGGQMQRVAIARALVNNPEIVLADEPTGALDSDTSVQVMELLKEVAKERLVVMVTHNPELASLYATRTVNLRDGKIRSDTDPFIPKEGTLAPPVHKNMGKSSMSFLTALSLSFQNLRTKKARTLLTSFAGSIGIIGIALILSISNGVNRYIQNMEEETLSEYPLQIQSTGFDLTSMMAGVAEAAGKENEEGTVGVTEMVTNMFSKMNSNDLQSLKEYLDGGGSGIEQYANSVEYTYSVSPQIFLEEKDGIRQVNPDQSFSSMGLGSSSSSNSIMSMTMSTDVFYEMPEKASLYEGQYVVKAGHWPENYQECVLVLTPNGNISDFLQYTLGLRDGKELDQMVEQFMEEETVETPAQTESYTYGQILGTTFRLVNAADYYEYDEDYKVWKDKTDNEEYMEALVKNGETLTIVGIVQPQEGATASMLTAGIGYPKSLTRHVTEEAKNSPIVQAQLADEKTNVFTGEAFGREAESEDDKFDLESLFQIDTDALQQAFQFDESALSLGLSGLSGSDMKIPDLSKSMQMDAGDLPDFSKMLDLSSLSLDLSDVLKPEDLAASIPAAPELDLSDMIGEMKFNFTEGGMQSLLTELLNGYQESIKDKPEADTAKMQAAIWQYLTGEEVTERVTEDIRNLAKNNIQVDVSSEQLIAAATRLMNQYQDYVKKNDIAEPGTESILAFLATKEAQDAIRSEAEKLLQDGVTVNITTEQIKEILVKDVLEGYSDYAKKNALPDPVNLWTYFMEYLQSEAGQQVLLKGLSSMIDISQVEQKFSEEMGTYMQSVMSAYTEAITKAVEDKFSDIMTQVTQQLTVGIQDAMNEMMKKIGTNMQKALQQVMTQITSSMATAMTQAMNQLGSGMENALTVDPDAFAKAIQMNMSEDELSELLMSLMTYENASCDDNLKKLGYADEAVPDGISVYPKDFESKEEVIRILDEYNARMEASGKEEQVISYTDIVGTLMSSVTDIVDIISYVLIAFVAISLVVSSIMIGVITYISVLERKKEIGILRAIGASKRNVSEVFNAETCIIGFCAGLMGIGITLALLVPGNMLIHRLADTNQVSAVLPALPALVLIALSIFLTFIGGLIPSRKAAKSDPVTALRNE